VQVRFFVRAGGLGVYPLFNESCQRYSGYATEDGKLSHLNKNKLMTVFKKSPFSNFSKGLAFAAALGCILQCPPAPAFADDEVLLKPDVPKLDTQTEAPKKTLKGTVQHSHKEPAPAPRKPLTSGANQSGSGFGIPGLGHFGSNRKQMKSKVKNNTLDASAMVGVGIIGVKFEMAVGRPPTIKLVFSGTPASEQGVQTNDVIVAVDGIPTYGLSKEEVFDLIVGTPHTPVTLSLQRGQDFSVKKMMRMDFNDIPDPQVKADYLKSM
jgi:hypothetical protein